MQQFFSPRRQQMETAAIHFGGDVSKEGYSMFAVEQDWKSKLDSDALTIHLRQSSYWINQTSPKRISKIYSQFRRMEKSVWWFRAGN